MLQVQFPVPGHSTVHQAESIRAALPATAVGFYRHGWQSWSLSAWTGLDPLPVPKPAALLPMQTDPVYVHEQKPHGSWLGAAGLKDGRICLLGALELNTHVWLEGDALVGRSEAGPVDWFLACGVEEEVFSVYATRLAERFGASPAKPAPRVWCSWYSLYTDISEERFKRIINGLDGLPFDVLQVDDGWQMAVGDWTPNTSFPSGMAALAGDIHRTHRQAGLWLAPLIAVRSSSLYRQHPDWFLRDEHDRPVSAGINWGEPLYALDTTLPEVTDWLADLVRQVRAWGYDYLKLDFLYAGALKGKRSRDIPREDALHQVLLAIRQASGDAFILTCGVPILPALGACDALRAGPDVAGIWESRRDAHLFSNPATPAGRNAVRTFVNRLWLQPLLHLDPDVVYFGEKSSSLTPVQRALLQEMAQVARFKATSDLPQQLTPDERQALEEYLKVTPEVCRTGRYTFLIDGREVDFSAEIGLPPAPIGLDAVRAGIMGWLGSQPAVLRFYRQQEEQNLRKRLAGIPGLE